MNSLSHFWCLPDLVGRPPGNVRSSSWRSDIRSCSAHRQFGSFWLLDPATWYPKLDQPFVNPVIVRLHDTLAVFVSKPEQAFFLNGRPDEWIDVRVDFRAHASSPLRLLL